MKPISTYISKVSFLALFIWFSTIATALGQEQTPETTDSVQDSLTAAYNENPFGVQLGIDVLKLGSIALDYETKYEGQVGLGYKRFYLILEAGYANYASVLAYKNSEDYEVEGQYYRIGFDYAFNIDAKSKLLVGIRYGSSTSEDRGTFKVTSELWEDYSIAVARTDAEANWGEVVLGSQTQITKTISFGWYFRWRKLFERTSYQPIDIYNVPGYGKSFDNSVPALNLFFKYNFTF